jgi:predicted RNA-binding Zn ribbon-like protein
MQNREYEFDLSGGIACLDFANTISRSLPVEQEQVNRYEDLVAFARQAGLVSDELAAQLRERAAARPEEAEAIRRRAVALREALFRVFAAVAADAVPPADDLAHLNREMSTALAQLRVDRPGRGRPGLDPGVRSGAHEDEDEAAFAWTWAEPSSHLDAPLWPLTRQAAELLVGPGLERVRECAAGDCRWLFVDTSKNRSRRWCDMKSCGNRAKVRRFYHRKREVQA